MRLVGLELGPGELRVAVAERSLSGIRVVSLERLAVPDARALERALERVAALRPARLLSALPLAATTHRFLALPFRDRRRLERTAPLELLGQLPGEIAGVRVATRRLGPALATSLDSRPAGPRGGTTMLAVAIRESDLDEHEAVLAGRALRADRIDLAPLPAWNLLDDGDATVLVADGTSSTLALRRDGRLAGLRALTADATRPDALARECRTVLEALAPAPTQLVLTGADATSALATALADATGAEVVRLDEAARVALPGPTDLGDACVVAAGLVVGSSRGDDAGLALRLRRAAGPAGAWRRTAVLAAAAAVLALMNVGLERVRLARYDALLRDEIEQVAAAALPGERVVAARAQLEAAAETARRARGAGRGAPVLELLRELSTRVPPALRLDLHELAVDGDGLHLRGRCASFDAVDSLRRALGTSPLLTEVKTEETRTSVDGRGVLFRMSARRRPPEGTSL